MEKIISAVSTFFKFVTPVKTILLVITIFSFLSAAIIWENRQSVYNSLMDMDIKASEKHLTLSEKSKARLDTLITRKSDYVTSAAALSINLSVNTKTILYRTFNSKELELRLRTIDAKEGIELPLFSSNEVQNKQILSLLRGEFSCSKTLPDSRYANAMEGKVTTTCRVPIPPAYGHLMGYIVFHLFREPTDQELDELRSEAYSLSMSIYNEMLGTSFVKRID